MLSLLHYHSIAKGNERDNLFPPRTVFYISPYGMLTWRIYLVYSKGGGGKSGIKKKTRLLLLSLPSLSPCSISPLVFPYPFFIRFFFSLNILWMWGSMRPGESLEGSRLARRTCISASRSMKRDPTKTDRGMTDHRGTTTVLRCFLWSLVLCCLSTPSQGNAHTERRWLCKLLRYI